MKRALWLLVALNLACFGFVAWQRAGQASGEPDALTVSVPVPPDAGGNTPVRKADHEVVMYGTAWCGYCAQARRYFADNGIRYTEHDIETSDEGRRGYEALGAQGIPVVVIDGMMLQGFNAERMDSLLAR